MPHKQHHHHHEHQHTYAPLTNPEDDGKNTIYAVLAMETILVLFFIALGVATIVLDRHQTLFLLFFSAHVIIFLDAIRLLRKYRAGSFHKKVNPDRFLEAVGRGLGGALVLIFDLFSLVLAIVDRIEYHEHAIWISTIVFWSLAALSTIVFLGVAIAYGEHQVEHADREKMKV